MAHHLMPKAAPEAAHAVLENRPRGPKVRCPGVRGPAVGPEAEGVEPDGEQAGKVEHLAYEAPGLEGYDCRAEELGREAVRGEGRCDGDCGVGEVAVVAGPGAGEVEEDVGSGAGEEGVECEGCTGGEAG